MTGTGLYFNSSPVFSNEVEARLELDQKLFFCPTLNFVAVDVDAMVNAVVGRERPFIDNGLQFG